VVNQSAEGIQVKLPRQWSKGGLVLFVLLPLVGGCAFPALFGLAIFGLLFLLVDYLLRSEKLVYIPEPDIQSGAYARAVAGTDPLKAIAMLLAFGVGVYIVIQVILGSALFISR
jgi:hypothetical protein